MKKLFVALIVVVMTLSAGISTVEAKRMGGGGSFGKKSQSMNRQAAPAQNQATNAAKPAAAAAAPAAAAAAKPSMWKGLLGGALLGLGLGALLSSLGLGGAMASMISNILMIALFAFAAMFIYKLVRRKMGNGAAGNTGNNGMQPAFSTPAPSSFTPEIASRIEQPMQRTAFDATPAATAVGAGAMGAAAWACLRISIRPVSCVTPRPTSCVCRQPGTRPTATISVNSRHRKCLPNCACNCKSAALRKTIPTSSRWMLNCSASKLSIMNIWRVSASAA
ncbi:hypothetical protein CAter10_4249 [Collimonas arenae]|nr:hypothetical protein CAter10_4249 [Collimonas arenae]